MNLTNINVGTSANDGTGDALRTAFQIVNANFTEVANSFSGQVTTTMLTAALADYVLSSAFTETINAIQAELTDIQSELDTKMTTGSTISISQVTNLQTTLNGKASVSSVNASISGVNDAIADINNTKLDDAPSDGNIYGRQNGAWVIIG
jgi:hypothetical protein